MISIASTSIRRAAAPTTRRAPAPARRVAAGYRSSDLRDFAVESLSVFQTPLMREMGELFGPELPADIEYEEEMRHPDAALDGKVFTCTYDEGFCGHFSVPGTDGAAVSFEEVFAQADHLAFLKNHLAFQPTVNAQPEGEVIIFTPGLNTIHMNKEGWMDEMTSPQRCQHYAEVLQRPLSQIHLGSDMDQGDAPVHLSFIAKTFLRYKKNELEAAGVMPRINGRHAYWDARQRDRIEAALGKLGLARPNIQTNITRILKRNEVEKKKIVLHPYSRSSAETARALRRYIANFIDEREDAGVSEADARREVEAYLREYVTVISFGNVTRRWPDGPAYVHVAHIGRGDKGTDPLPQQLGSSTTYTAGGGADAVFLCPDGVFSGFDAHNYAAAGASNLRIIMKMNGCVAMRDLWEKGQEGPLKLPNLEESSAGAALSGGERWLWQPDMSYDDVNLPDAETARQILGENW